MKTSTKFRLASTRRGAGRWVRGPSYIFRWFTNIAPIRQGNIVVFFWMSPLIVDWLKNLVGDSLASFRGVALRRKKGIFFAVRHLLHIFKNGISDVVFTPHPFPTHSHNHSGIWLSRYPQHPSPALGSALLPSVLQLRQPHKQEYQHGGGLLSCLAFLSTLILLWPDLVLGDVSWGSRKRTWWTSDAIPVLASWSWGHRVLIVDAHHVFDDRLPHVHLLKRIWIPESSEESNSIILVIESKLRGTPTCRMSVPPESLYAILAQRRTFMALVFICSSPLQPFLSSVQIEMSPEVAAKFKLFEVRISESIGIGRGNSQ